MTAACLATSCGPVPGLVAGLERERLCPGKRIVVREREDLHPHDFACMNKPRWAGLTESYWWQRIEPFWKLANPHLFSLDCGGPPPEIVEDPARGRVWKEIHDRKLVEADGDVRIFEVSACGPRQFYGCRPLCQLNCGYECPRIGDVDPRDTR